MASLILNDGGIDIDMKIMYHLTVSAKLAEKYAMYKPATEGAGKKNGKID